ncbi:nucleotidyltransferase domain-containing protein [Methylobacterium sp. NEAU 140]|uniref:nucleotidyltransferase domain-containing protein n=1 Tax=Methylobacterium sp. NEAU 140 TaxID=3064945 RepID=UPI00273337A4|nr:nucleotidyltransferase domain-containing protein [Methylobacterium sp. NEAU 140]MDP4021331.1 nucleotidyltransferase domain-containing protein [Methylobacterium sp. NEAU 140]
MIREGPRSAFASAERALAVAVERLRAVAPVERVILFGSRARGDQEADSDWDLCVLLRDDIPAGLYTPAALWRAVRGLGLTLQIVPMRRSVFDGTRGDVNALAHDVARDGIVLFDAGPRHGVGP